MSSNGVTLGRNYYSNSISLPFSTNGFPLARIFLWYPYGDPGAGERVYYRQTTTDTNLLTKLSDDISAYGCDGSFHATYAIVVTWYNVSRCRETDDPPCVSKTFRIKL